MKETILTTLRDQATRRGEFRRASQQLIAIMAQEASTLLPVKEKTIHTPLAETKGTYIGVPIVLVSILRAGLSMIPTFVDYFPEASVGFLGMQRDETTAMAHQYYQNLPPLSASSYLFLLDPMLATGGTAEKAIEALLAAGAQEKNIIFVGIIAAKEGMRRIQNAFPDVRLLLTHVDAALDDARFIVPGLGDFGDRFYGTV